MTTFVLENSAIPLEFSLNQNIMAVGQNLLFGRMKNKIGGVVASTWKGINVIKSKPLTVANPRTDSQVMRRSALIQIMAIARRVAAAVKLGFKEQAVYKSAFNAFVGYCLRNSFDYSAPPVADIEIANLVMSQGTISPTAIATAASDVSNGNTAITWATALSGPGQSTTDLAMLVLYNQTQDVWYPLVSAIDRSIGALSVLLAQFDFDDGDLINAWLFFYNTTTRKSSDSVFENFVATA